MLQRGRIVSCTMIVIGVLALAGSSLAIETPSPLPELLQASPAISSPVETPASLDQALAQVGTPEPIFLSPLTECWAACSADFAACRMHNPYSFCLQLYNQCRCTCTDTCNP